MGLNVYLVIVAFDLNWNAFWNAVFHLVCHSFIVIVRKSNIAEDKEYWSDRLACGEGGSRRTLTWSKPWIQCFSWALRTRAESWRVFHPGKWDPWNLMVSVYLHECLYHAPSTLVKRLLPIHSDSVSFQQNLEQWTSTKTQLISWPISFTFWKYAML